MNTLSTNTTVNSNIPAEPTILSANTYFWNSGGSASSRRSSENRRQAEVADYLTALGFEVKRNGDHVIGTLGELRVNFYYAESCQNVYKSLDVTRAGKRSNITAIRKIAANLSK